MENQRRSEIEAAASPPLMIKPVEASLPAGLFAMPRLNAQRDGLDALLAHVSCTVVRAGWFTCPGDWSRLARLDGYDTLLVCVDGRGEVILDGRSHRLLGGGVMLVPPHVRLTLHQSTAERWQFLLVQFAARLYGVLDATRVYGLPRAMWPAPERMAAIVEAARRLVNEIAVGEAGCTLAVDAECARLFVLLWRVAMLQAPSAPQAGDHMPSGSVPAADVSRLAPVFHTIQWHYEASITVRQMAAAVHLHPSYFSTQFKRVTGLTPMQYLAAYRLERARELLLGSALTVGEIATATGYRDPFYFSRVFRHAEGLSPRDYRRAKKNPALA